MRFMNHSRATAKMLQDGSFPVTAENADRPLHERIIPILREAIVRREWPPGSRLVEVTLARQLNVSRTPIRTALAYLEREGLVSVIPHVGAFVREISLKDIDEIYEARIAIETSAVALAARRIERVGQAQVASLLDGMRFLVQDSDVEGYAAALDEFHELILRLSGNGRLESMYTQLMPAIRRLRRINLDREGRPSESLRQHAAVAELLLEGDEEAAAKMREHLEDAWNQVRQVALNMEPHLKSSRWDRGTRGDHWGR